jgi:hypothetical protein
MTLISGVLQGGEALSLFALSAFLSRSPLGQAAPPRQMPLLT